jgi:hypothetical protein
MRKFASLLPLVALLGFPGVSRAQGFGNSLEYQGDVAFDFRECLKNATHILVVDMRGRVLEVWKGDSAVGDHIPIDRFYLSVLARINASRCFELPKLEKYWSGDSQGTPFASDKLILFLVKSDRQDEASRFLDGWLPAGDGWFESSTARVDKWCVRVRRRPLLEGGLLGSPGYRGSEEQFKSQVMEATKKTESGEKK